MNPANGEGTPSQKILVSLDGGERVFDLPAVLEKLDVSSVIRIPESEYGNIDAEQGYLGHFNLESTNHEVGKRYVLPRIVRNGAVLESGEVLPLLSFENTFIAECIEAENNLSYDTLSDSVFEHSMRGIQDKKSLEKVILGRYSKSRPHVSSEEILSKGVAFTLLKILKKIDNIN